MKFSNIIFTDDIFKHLNNDNFVFIIDHNVYSLYEEFCTLRNFYIFKSYESQKSFTSVNKMLKFFINKNLSRHSTVVAIGGGTLLDTVGFTASIYKRGLNLIFIPTTLLAMADASIGGKNAINFNNVKNIIGTFYLPELILINVNFLNSLNNMQIKSGLLEIVKTSLLFSYDFYKYIDYNILKILKNDITIFSELIQRSVNYKVNIVINDLYDTNNRKLLNFGHTIAHSIELTRKLPHGIAVGYGMLFIQKYAERFYNANPAISENLNNLLIKMKIRQFNFELSEYELDLIFQDKKLSNNEIDIVFLRDYEYPIIQNVNINELRNQIQNMS